MSVRQKSPAQRTNDLHHFQRHRLTPANGTVRKMAELVLHERQEPQKPKKRCNIGNKNSAKRRFTEEEVKTLRRRFKAGKRICDLAREFDMDVHAMTYLLKGVTYAWVRE